MNPQIVQALFLTAMAVYCVRRRNARFQEPGFWIYYIFLCSGFPALIYQIVWERALFTIYGVNVESVTIVVTGFMLGLGLGSLLGGYLSRVARDRLLAIFAGAELATGIYGLLSLRLFHEAARYSAGTSLATTAFISFGLLLLPTILMGSTLPILIEETISRSHNMGRSLGLLYFVNTLGSAAVCFLAAGFTMRVLGQAGSVTLAALINTAVALTVLTTGMWHRASSPLATGPASAARLEDVEFADRLSLLVAIIFVAVAGFIALAYEIIWYRLFSFWSASNARVFAIMLGAYLAGVAIGGLVVHDLTTRGKTRSTSEYLRLVAGFVVTANLIGFMVGPVMSWAARFGNGGPVLLMIALAAALLGAVFPLICHLSIEPNSTAGSNLSILYFSNIIGAALGSFVVGFVIMNVWGLRAISTMLVLAGVGFGVALLAASRPSQRQLTWGVAGAAVLCLVLVALANPLFNGLYEQLLQHYDHRPFRYLVENRSGVLAVDQRGTVYGGGIYDGVFNIDLMHDVNGLIRIYALAAFDPAPRRVLMIGLASGSWAQIIANNPEVEEETVVEINPGYLQVIPHYPAIAGLLRNPKVTIAIDDGRRWLLANPQRKFDLIVMNTTFSWREHISNLLSVEFLDLARRHLNPGGIIYYNTTDSCEVLRTGATVFPYALRVVNFLAVSDQPIEVDSGRLERTLSEYRIEGRPVLNLALRQDSERLSQVIAITRRFNSDPGFETPSLEYGDSIRARCRAARIITDDNMGTEWMN